LPKTCAALVLTDTHLTFEMVQCTGTDSCYLHRPSPCNWLQSDNLNAKIFNWQFGLQFNKQFFSALHERGVWGKTQTATLHSPSTVGVLHTAMAAQVTT